MDRNLSRRTRREWDNPLALLREGLEDFFSDFGRPLGFRGRQEMVFPRVDVSETEDTVNVRAEIPGIRPEDVQIDVTDNVLTLRGEKTSERQDEGRNYQYCECEYGSFVRSIPLPTGIDPDRVNATNRRGCLVVDIPKRPDAKPRRINVRSAEEQEMMSPGGPRTSAEPVTAGQGGSRPQRNR